MLYPSSRISNQSLKDIAEEPSAPIATNWDTGRKIVISTNVPIATYTNPTTRNICASSNHSDLTADPRHPSNRNRRHHHHSPSKSPIREGSKQENPRHPLPPQPPHRLPTEESKRTKGRGRKRTIILANKERPKEKLIGPLMTSKGNGIEGWRNSPNNKTNPTTTTTKPSTTSTKSHLDFRSSWKFRTVDGG